MIGGITLLTAAMMGLGVIFAGPLGLLVAAGLVGLIALSAGLLMFGASLVVLGKGLNSLTVVD